MAFRFAVVKAKRSALLDGADAADDGEFGAEACALARRDVNMDLRLQDDTVSARSVDSA